MAIHVTVELSIQPGKARVYRHGVRGIQGNADEEGLHRYHRDPVHG